MPVLTTLGLAAEAAGSVRVDARAAASTDPAFSRCLAGLQATAATQGIGADRFNEITAGLTPDPSVLGLLDAQPEFTTPIWDYLAALVDRQRVADGRALLQQHRDLLDRVSAQYGVDPAT
ncbi:lytic murein transglycosylase, partial [Stenotrophomonas maltophilia]|uniref:lytic murein transglycosylase n=1 Tax=Stenotrophomonas maltophilia TaxID=40324 RepID=UPI0019D49E0F